MKAAVITCSNRSATGERADDSGELLASMLTAMGHEIVLRRIVPDDVEQIRAAIADALAAGARAVVTTGGTGLTPTDVTPEAVRTAARARDPRHRRGAARGLARTGADLGVCRAAWRERSGRRWS